MGFSQIVNIERARMQSDTVGWLGSAGASLSLTRNSQQVFNSDLDAHIQYKSKKNLYLLLGNYGFLKGGNTKLIDYAFLHLRFNTKITRTLRWEIFTQLQDNVINRIQWRFLLGTGPRFKLVSTKICRLYAAALLMYEQERESGSHVNHTDIRSSSYVSLTVIPNNNVEIISTTFFQPLLKDINDYRLLNQTSLKVKAGKHVRVKINWNYLNDNFPAPGIPSVNYTLATGFDYEF
jgi:hypothetical protein